MGETRRKPILVVDDDPIDREMIELAFKRAGVESPIVAVEDGQEALAYLLAQGQFRTRLPVGLPALIVLDLDMPRMDGFEFLRQIKAHQDFTSIPVVVLTTSQYDRDLARSYALGASSCIAKPGNFEQLVEIARALGAYWCDLNRVPQAG